MPIITHMDTINVRQKITELFHKYDRLARHIFPAYRDTPVPTLEFFIKGRKAGQAIKSSWTVRINEYVAPQDWEAAENTISHEIAHMVDFARRGYSNHDEHWRSIHIILGGNGVYGYRQAVKVIPQRKTMQYLYRNAQGREVWVGPRYHSSFQKTESGFKYIVNGVTHRFAHTDFTGESRVKPFDNCN